MMNSDTMELNLNELEMISGGDVLDRVKGTLIGAGIGCVSMRLHRRRPDWCCSRWCQRSRHRRDSWRNGRA